MPRRNIGISDHGPWPLEMEKPICRTTKTMCQHPQGMQSLGVVIYLRDLWSILGVLCVTSCRINQRWIIVKCQVRRGGYVRSLSIRVNWGYIAHGVYITHLGIRS